MYFGIPLSVLQETYLQGMQYPKWQENLVYIITVH